MRISPLIAAAQMFAFAELRAEVIISEFVADNANGIEDETGSREDWIELFNNGAAAVDLDGWWLTDSVDDPVKWQIPAVSIPANGTLLVWASGRDRTDPAAPLHTNFGLSKNGEYLGLYQPSAGTGQPELVFSFGSSYPRQAPDVSYGVPVFTVSETLVASAEAGRYTVLPNDATGAARFNGGNYAGGEIGNGLAGGWNVSAGFNDGAWTSGATGIGYDTGGGLNPWIGSNCQAALYGVNASLCFRRTFQVTDPVAGATYKLRMKYEDGFVAYINGIEVGRANFDGSPAYNSAAKTSLNGTIVNSWTEFVIPESVLVAGGNLLAIQGLNVSPTSSDFLLLPEITVTVPAGSGSHVYFNPPTPGAVNGAGSAGPVVYDATPADPDVPRPSGNSSSPPMTVTLHVIRTENPLAAVRVVSTTMWGGESSFTMLDNGIAPDTISGDGIYAASLPTTGPGPGEMFRWRFEAEDNAGRITRLPSYVDSNDSPRYFGTVAVDSTTGGSLLPVLAWFVDDAPANGPTATAFRGSCYYLNRFYDNIGHEIHGQSTASFNKKSYDFDSNSDFRFVWKEGERPVKDLNLLSNYADKSKTRNTLAHEVGRMAGTPYHFCFPVRVQLNASFHGVMDLMEDGDDRMLERNGLDGEGALYKIYNYLESVSGAEKKTRKEENKNDLQALIDALNPGSTLSNRRRNTYDLVNLPALVNYMAARTITSDRDHGQKNYYMYRDTEGTGEWRPITWDVDLSFGHDWDVGPKYFDDTIYYGNFIRSDYTTENRLYQVLADSAEIRAMYLRRLRTLMDTVLQPPGTVNGILETRMREIAASIDPDPANPSSWTDGDLDASRWGVWGRGLRPREETEYVISHHFSQRRTFLFNQNSSTRQRFGLTEGSGDPIPDAGQTDTAGMVVIDSVDFLPVSGNQDEEYVILRNTTSQAVDLSNWTLDGAVSHVFEGGTVIPVGNGSSGSEYKGLLHVAKSSQAFRSRATGPQGGQKRFVQGNYVGQLSARGETLNLRDAAGQLIATFSYVGAPTVHQRYLKLSEIQYHPAGPTESESLAMPGVGEDDFEYLEFVNVGPTRLELEGVTFTAGVEFVFPATSLAAGERLILAKNPSAFALRYPSTTCPVVGPYAGFLANTGERLELTDPVGENVFDFEYKDGWYAATDGSGRSLVQRDPAGAEDGASGDPLSWGISGDAFGSPGWMDASLAQGYYGWDNFHFSTLERDDPLVSGPDADPDGDGRTNAEEYALATDPRVADLPVVDFVWSMEGGTRRPALRFRRPSGAVDVTYQLQAGDGLTEWPVVTDTPVGSVTVDGETEEVVFRDAADDSLPRRFLRLAYRVNP